MIQLITPNPNIPCQPGWCLQYVRQAFGLPARHPTATAAWEASASKHRDRNFPQGVWLPVWFSLANEPAGHVALMAPDGSVYSTSDLGSVPHQHLDLSDLMNYYARYGMTLTYLGWTEDVAGYPVITSSTIASQGDTKAPQEDEMTPEQWKFVQAVLTSLSDNVATKTDVYALKVWDQQTDNSTGDRIIDALRADIGAMPAAVIADLIPENLVQDVLDGLAKRLVK